ncbi:hypothetical protein PROFUN_11718 [Planoprotostelium fungivorum]|uniref:Capsule polysaccharide biosynthesis protein n=1 Tax=Planoprotostelium fungivorum TaxID=1890364 RepID=A0A2P6N966_9EUKA|nr:hypothetical protein PROFUN_11718 [Planoprotostelium fungivorum]
MQSTTPTEIYSIPDGVHAIPLHRLDLRSDDEIDHTLLHPEPPTSSEKNIWFFWHKGFSHMHPYTKRNVRAWHRRFSKQGWTVRVVDRVPGSSLNIDKFLDVADPNLFPKAFLDGTIGGDYAPQHTSDLVRWPLLLRYGGVYADVGLMQIGDIDAIWNETIGNPQSPYEILSYSTGGPEIRCLTNYFLASGRNNPLFERCHRLFMSLWAADGGKISTEGMHSSPLLKQVPMMTTDSPDGMIPRDELTKMLTDYIIQGQVMSLVMNLVDEEDHWDGPHYVREHVYVMEFMIGAQLINDLTQWDGQRAFRLMSLPLPQRGQEETEDQKAARNIVEMCLSKSFGFKLAHGLILKVYGDTLGSLWRKHEGSDDVVGTYGHWLRHGMIYWEQDELPKRVDVGELKPYKTGPMMRG